MSETDHTHRFIVEIPSFGDPEKEFERSKLSLARALHHWVKPGCLIGVSPAVDDMQIDVWYRFEPKGDDMGNHGDEFPTPLVEL